MLEFTVREHRYRSRKMNARQQFHVARRLGPLFGQLLSMAPALAQAPNPNGETPGETTMAFEHALEGFASALARVPDADCDYVLDRCMEATQRLSGTGNGAQPVWADVWNPRAARMMFEDINLPEMMQIASEVLRDNLGNFFSMSPPQAVTTQVEIPGLSASTS
jgi:hypothetical protein